MYGQLLGDPGDEKRNNSFQGLVAFPSADLAARYVDRQRALWPKCAYKTVRVSATAVEPEFYWRITDVDVTGKIISAEATRQETDRTCQHALTASNNLVIDVLACAADKPDPAITIAQALADGIPH